MAAADKDGDNEATLQALLAENEELRIENEALLAEARRCGLDPEGLPDPLDAVPGLAVMQGRLDALKKEREALAGVMRLGDELQEMQATNAKLREEASLLNQENTALKDRNKVLRLTQGRDGGDSKEIVASPAAAEAAPASPLSKEFEAMQYCSPEKRKELIASLLKAGFFDAVAAEEGSSTPGETSAAEAAPQTDPGGPKLPPPARKAGSSEGSARQPSVLDRQASDIAETLRAGNIKVIGTFSHQQRKELATQRC
eukprot:CAMPEP_0178409064 /NCGR_PEP_ID=MMETSP0689_2-20121128/20267_1 /TAXON_ID=160604 /ORGANISM="Amphidinium massartii, Strain CS-259" /LENGTH=256 /DNA_ID=CAMNT_0020030189 /DNA_START=1 /DNA_END=771 /DNA_ORIENTATION=-